VLVLAERHGEDEVDAGAASPCREEEGNLQDEAEIEGEAGTEGGEEARGLVEGADDARRLDGDGGGLARAAARLLRSRPLTRRLAHLPTHSLTVSIISLTTSPCLMRASKALNSSRE